MRSCARALARQLVPLALIGCAVVILAAALVIVRPVQAHGDALDAEWELWGRIADYRGTLGIPARSAAISTDRFLLHRAHQRAIDMVVGQQPFEHTDMGALYTANGYSWEWWAEDLAIVSNPNQALTSWLDSPAHRAIIEDPRYNRIAVGARQRDDGMWVVVGLFVDK